MRWTAVLLKTGSMLSCAWRSWLWRKLLHAPGLQVQADALIIGDRHIRVGQNFRAGRLLWLEAVTGYGAQPLTPFLKIGNRVKCSDAVHIACASTVTVGDDVLIGSKVHITDHNHGNYAGPDGSLPEVPPAMRALVCKPVVIGDRVFLGDGVVVLPGSRIGAGTVVGANSVVNGELPPESICAGQPARVIKRFDNHTKTWARRPQQEHESRL